ncbi:MAG: C40 family peptidase [Bacteroidetes bacterium]|nr:C40 family peptidase [Bacteroidota bacterium]
MNVLYRVTYLILSASFIFLYYGCSSSSGTSRYGNKSDDSETNNTSVRFSSEDDNNESTYVSEDSGDLPDDDAVDIGVMLDKYNLDPDENNFETGTPKEKMLMEIIKYINVPYQYGGNSKSGIDCSAFTQSIYKNTLSVNLFRSAREQYKQGEGISDVEELRFGDLVFFNTRENVRPGHVGIYIGDNLFAHASTKKGVTISSINHSYYKTRFMGGRRVKSGGTF